MPSRIILLAVVFLAAHRPAVARAFSPTSGAHGAARQDLSTPVDTVTPAGASVATTKSTYGAGEPVTVVWSGMASVGFQIWLEAPDAPLSIVPHGAMHFAGGPAGQWTVGPLPPGKIWEIRYTGTDGPHRGAQFTVGAASVARARVGRYGCYTTTYTGLTRSSIQWVELVAADRYREPRGQGVYTVNPATATVHMTTGPLAGRVAHVEVTGAGTPGLYFALQENLDHGRPTIDVSGTMCRLGQP